MAAEKTGRPPLPIDWKRVDELLIAGCTGVEVAAVFDMHPDTLYKKVEGTFGITFTNYSAQKRQKGDTILREAQFNKAKKGDNVMLVWLGKNRLSQKETHDLPVAPNDAQLNEVIANLKSLSGKLDSLKKEEAAQE